MSLVCYGLVLLVTMSAASQQLPLKQEYFQGSVWMRERLAANTNPSSDLTDKDKIVLADLTNSTEDEVFHGALERALRVALDESPFLNVLAEVSVADTLKDMARQENTPRTPEIARTVCQRTNSKAYVAGSISAQGTEFAVALKAIDCMSGETLALAQSTAQGKDKVLDALGEAVSKLRVQLGEPLDSVREFRTPLSRATTTSFEALQAWSAGITAQKEKGAAAAIPFFEAAVRLDPNFASALFDLGLTYRNSQQEALARNLFIRAFAVRSHASARKRFSIEGLYYSFVTVEYERAVETYRQWRRIYPRDERPVSNLGSFYGDVCEYGQAIAQFKEARRMNPKNFIVHEDLIEILTAAGEFEEAREAYSEMLRMKLDDDAPHVYMYSVAFLEHDVKEMGNQAAWFNGKPDVQHEILSEQADTEAYDGHLARARELTTQAVQLALSAHNSEQAAAWLLNASWREDLFGHIREAHDQAVRALEMAPDSREGEAMAAILFARTGDVPRATVAAEDLEKRYPDHPVVQSYWLPCIRAQIALTQKDPSLALRLLRTAVHYDTLLPQVAYYSHMPSVVLRAEAYSALGQPTAALKEWKGILKYPGIVQLSATAPIARLQLARASARQAVGTGNAARTEARTAYQDFLSLWKGADSNIPLLKEAKAEFTKLQ
jgi:tetratricopeptide (TPR) repeat protein